MTGNEQVFKTIKTTNNQPALNQKERDLTKRDTLCIEKPTLKSIQFNLKEMKLGLKFQLVGHQNA